VWISYRDVVLTSPSRTVFNILITSSWMLERPKFLQRKRGILTPFSTSFQWQTYFYNELKKYPMLLIVWLHKVCPGLDLKFIFGGHTYDEKCKGVGLNDLKAKMKGSLSSRLL
jgi:hypothetical protein